MMTPARLKKYALTYHQAERVRHARPPKWETDPAAVEAGIEWRGPGQTTLETFGLRLVFPWQDPSSVAGCLMDLYKRPDVIYYL
jgi:hypothetical protein